MFNMFVSGFCLSMATNDPSRGHYIWALLNGTMGVINLLVVFLV